MAITKDQVSDLKSKIEALVRAELDFERSGRDLNNAKSQLDEEFRKIAAEKREQPNKSPHQKLTQWGYFCALN